MTKVTKPVRALGEAFARPLSRSKQPRKVAIGSFGQYLQGVGFAGHRKLNRGARGSLEDPRNVKAALEGGAEEHFIIDCKRHMVELA